MDVLVLNYNDADTTIGFVNSIKGFSIVRKILVVDNCSTDSSFDRLKELVDERIAVIKTKNNGGYGAGNNAGIRFLYENVNSEYILLCNPDVAVSEKVCENLEDFLQSHDDYAIAAPFMLNSKGFRQNNTAFRIPSTMLYILSLSVIAKKLMKPFDCGKEALDSGLSVYDVGAVAGSLFLMNAKKMIEYGMYDEEMFLYCEEVVLGKKMELNCQKIALLPKLEYIHNHSVSISKTYSSLLKRQKLLVRSKLFVIRKYFKANFFERILAYVLVAVSYIEVFLFGLLKK